MIYLSALGSPEKLITAAQNFMNSNNLPTDLVCDHVCYRVSTEQRYQELKQTLQPHAKLMHESLVNGRNICIFKMSEAIVINGFCIECIELPAPNLNSQYQEGWEHLEFVTRTSLSEFLETYPSLPWDKRAFHKTINPELCLKISQNEQIKFHEQSILQVIAQEKFNEGSLSDLQTNY